MGLNDSRKKKQTFRFRTGGGEGAAPLYRTTIESKRSAGSTDTTNTGRKGTITPVNLTIWEREGPPVTRRKKGGPGLRTLDL